MSPKIETKNGQVMVRLSTPFTMIVSGQTGSGKTEFVLRLIRNNADINTEPFDRIVYAYSIMQEELKRIEAETDILTLHEGFPDNLDWPENNTLLVLDDLMLELRNDDRLAKMFTKMRHRKISTIFLTQNLYFQSRYATTVTRNAQYVVLFANPRDNAMIDTLGRQAFPRMPHFLSSAFEMVTEEPYGYLFLDFKPDTPKELRVRSNVFPGDTTKVYKPLGM